MQQGFAVGIDAVGHGEGFENRAIIKSHSTDEDAKVNLCPGVQSIDDDGHLDIVGGSIDQSCLNHCRLRGGPETHHAER